MRKLLVCLALALASCGTAESAEKAAAGIDTFHTQLDARQFDAIWRESGQGMKDASPKDGLVKLLDAVNRKLGRVESSKRVGWRINATVNGTFAVIQQDTKFTRGKAQETFTFQKNGDRYRLVGYNINSNDMMVN